jgi:hypothetical protein
LSINSSSQATTRQFLTALAHGDETYSASSRRDQLTWQIVEVVVDDAKNILDKKLEKTILVD